MDDLSGLERKEFDEFKLWPADTFYGKEVY
jgi:hypothetical protein